MQKLPENLQNMRKFAENNKVPIIAAESVEWLDFFLCDKKIENILEIGGAISYSAQVFYALTGASIVSVERDDERFNIATNYLNSQKLTDVITFCHDDAASAEFFDIAVANAPYDLLFIDATKRENRLFFEKFSPLLKVGGYVITDNINFHGLTGTDEEIKKLHRRIRPLVRAIIAYRNWLPTLSTFETAFYDVGDTLAVSKKIAKEDNE